MPNLLPHPRTLPSLRPNPTPNPVTQWAPVVPAGDEGPDWRRALSALLRFRWWIALGALLGTGAGVFLARRIPPIYAAEATVWVEVDPRSGARGGPIQEGRLLDADAWVELLRSYIVMDEVARRLRLFIQVPDPIDNDAFAALTVRDRYHPGEYRLAVDNNRREYMLTTDDGAPLERGQVGDSVGRRLGIDWAPEPATLLPGRTLRFRLVSLRDAARHLTEQLGVRTDQNGNFLRLELQGDDPERVTAIVNAVAERYIAVAGDLKGRKLAELARILDGQLAAASGELRSAETALERFRVQNVTLPTQMGGPPGANAPRDPVVSGFFDMSVEREQVRRDREDIGRALAQVPDSGSMPEGLAVIGSVQHSAALSEALKEMSTKEAERRAMRYRYADEYPPLVRLTADIATLRQQTIPALARALGQELKGRETQLSSRLGSTSHDLQQIPARAIEEARLQRAVTIAENLYTTVEKRHQEVNLAAGSLQPDVRLLDVAVVPHQPIKHTAGRFVLLGFCAGLGLAVAGALLIDRADPRLRYPTEVETDMGLPMLGFVPHLRMGRSGVAATEEEAAEAFEGLRGIRLGVANAYGARPIVFAVTSPGIGDGKTFMSSNLAVAFATSGLRTLLIDADLRRGMVHRRLGVRRRPGLTEYLRGEAARDEVIQGTSVPSLWVVGAGQHTRDAPELLESDPMRRLLDHVRTVFDVVICDCPPLGAGVDAYVLGTLTGNQILVLRAGVSHRMVARACLEALSRLPVRILGAVLNDVPADTAYGYYFYPYAPNYLGPADDGPRKEKRRRAPPLIG